MVSLSVTLGVQNASAGKTGINYATRLFCHNTTHLFVTDRPVAEDPITKELFGKFQGKDVYR